MGLKKSCRLKLDRQFQALLKHGQRKQFESLVIYWDSPASGQEQQLGIRISGKLAKAVARNRVKRLLRENFRLQIPFLKKPLHLLVIVKYYQAAQWDHVSKIGAALHRFFKENGLFIEE